MHRRRPAPPAKTRGNLTHAEHNAARVPGTHVTGRDIVEAMAVYDTLPPRMRQELRRAPFNVDPIGARDCIQQHGEHRALDVLRNSLSIGLTKSLRETRLRTGVCRD